MALADENAQRRRRFQQQATQQAAVEESRQRRVLIERRATANQGSARRSPGHPDPSGTEEEFPMPPPRRAHSSGHVTSRFPNIHTPSGPSADNSSQSSRQSARPHNADATEAKGQGLGAADPLRCLRNKMSTPHNARSPAPTVLQVASPTARNVIPPPPPPPPRSYVGKEEEPAQPSIVGRALNPPPVTHDEVPEEDGPSLMKTVINQRPAKESLSNERVQQIIQERAHRQAGGGKDDYVLPHDVKGRPGMPPMIIRPVRAPIDEPPPPNRRRRAGANGKRSLSQPLARNLVRFNLEGACGDVFVDGNGVRFSIGTPPPTVESPIEADGGDDDDGPSESYMPAPRKHKAPPPPVDEPCVDIADPISLGTGVTWEEQRLTAALREVNAKIAAQKLRRY